MARTVGPGQLTTLHGDKALRRNDLADSMAAFIAGERQGESSVNLSRLGLALVGKVDEEISFANRAPDDHIEAYHHRSAANFSHRAKLAFTESLNIDRESSSSALAHFGAGFDSHYNYYNIYLYIHNIY